MKYFLFIFFILIFHSFKAQNFQRIFSGPGDDRGHAVITTNDGGYAISGYTTSFGSGGQDLFILKTDSQGNILWQKTYGSSGNEEGTSVVITETPDFGFVIAGSTTGFAANSLDFYVVRVDNAGNLLWSSKYNSPSDSEHARGIKVAANGDIIVIGTDNADFFGSADGLVMRLDSNGNRLWSKVYGGGVNDHFHGIEELPGGNLIISGSTTTFGPGSTAGYVLKLDPDGNVIWDYTYGSSNTDAYNSSSLTNDYEIVLTGLTNSFGGGYQVFTTKIDTNGVLLWSKAYGGASYERGAAISKVYNSSDYFIAANTESYGNGQKEILMLRIDANGNIIWSETFGTNLNDEMDSWATKTLCPTTDGGFVLTGYSNGIYSGGNNILLLKSDGVGQFMCDPTTVNTTNANVNRINPPTNTANSGNYAFVTSNSLNANFVQNEPCICPVEPSFNAIPDICQNSTAPILPNTSLEGLSGTWSPATINTSVLGTFTYTFTPSMGSCANNSSLTVNIVDGISPNFNAIGSLCQDGSPPVLPTTSLNGISGTWSPVAVNTSSAGIQNFVFTPDPGQCAFQTNINIEVLAPSIIPTFNAIGPLCQDATPPLLPTTSINGINGTWSPSVITTSIVGNENFVFTPDPGQCALQSDIDIQTTAPSIVPIFNLSPQVCLNTTPPVLPTTSSNGINGTWSPTSIPTNSIGIQNLVFTPNSGQCAIQTNVEVEIIDSPPLDFVFDELIGCSPLTVNFTSNSSGISNCLWDFGGAGTSTSCSNAEFTFNSPGIYYVNFSAEWMNTGCSSTYTSTQAIEVLASPFANFNVSATNLSSEFTTVNFFNLSQNATEYLWTFSGLDESLETNPSYTFPGEANNYSVCLIAYNTLGCTDTTCRTILVSDELVFYIPNSFSPDGDEYNNTFHPIFSNGGVGIDGYELTIFNRWGEIIWESRDPLAAWDATYLGKDVQDGTYTWTLRFSYQSIGQEHVGHINVIR